MSPRTGRPKAENPKDKELRVRIDKETEQILKELAQHYNVPVSVVVRMGIRTALRRNKKVSVVPAAEHDNAYHNESPQPHRLTEWCEIHLHHTILSAKSQ